MPTTGRNHKKLRITKTIPRGIHPARFRIAKPSEHAPDAVGRLLFEALIRRFELFVPFITRQGKFLWVYEFTGTNRRQYYS
jgi:hypothetical protein